MPDLFPPDPTRSGTYSVLRPDGQREDIHWSHAAHAWFPADGSIFSPAEMGSRGYSGPRYIKGVPPQTLDDRQAPVWTLKEPGVLTHRDGRHAVKWNQTSRAFVAWFNLGTPDECGIGVHHSPEDAKAAAERHAAWCKEFGYE